MRRVVRESRRAPAAEPGFGLDELLATISRCRLCIEAPNGRPLPHEPRPVLRADPRARIAVAGQAPGTRVHVSGIPFTDPSGVRLRSWMGIGEAEFYDASRIAIVPMGFCFPGLDASGADLPPRRECAPAWRDGVMAHLPRLELLLMVGRHAMAWHLPDRRGETVGALVKDWRAIVEAPRPGPALFPLPHPSWRNSAWLKRNPWFEQEAVPDLRHRISHLLKA